MVEVNSRVYGGQTGGERTQQRRAALLAAAFELVSERGWRELRIEPLCRRATLNKRYFYESFRDLDAVIEALTRQLSEDAIAATMAGIGPDTAQGEAITLAVRQLVTHLTDDPRRAAVLFGAVPAGETAAGHRAGAIRRVIATAAAEGRTLNDIGDDPLVDVVAAMLVGGTSQAVLDWLGGEVVCDRAALIDELTALWEAIGEVVARRAAERVPAGGP